VSGDAVHQPTWPLLLPGELKRAITPKWVMGFTRVAENINDLSESGELGNENDSSASTGDHPDLDIKTVITD
jgi:hypothetical protein